MTKLLRSLAALLLLACLLVTPLLAFADGPAYPYPPPPGGGENSIIELADGPAYPYPPPPGGGGDGNSIGSG